MDVILNVIVKVSKTVNITANSRVHFNYTSVISSSAHPLPPPGNSGAFAYVVSPGGGALAILSRPVGWAFAYPGETPAS